MTEELAVHLVALANKYETATFPEKDPCQFLRWYDIDKAGTANVECASFIAAMLAFGSRKQFIPKIREILNTADNWVLSKKGDRPLCLNADYMAGVADWCIAGAPGFPQGEKKFYRFYSYDDMHCLFKELACILSKYGTLGEYFKNQSEGTDPFLLSSVVSSVFPESSIVPKGKNSANKRIHMFLRWMVRQNSPVDLGIWKWTSPATLLIPLDVHVMEEAINLGLLPPEAKPSYKTARKLSELMNQVFPGDPVRSDFALFGLGVDED